MPTAIAQPLGHANRNSWLDGLFEAKQREIMVRLAPRTLVLLSFFALAGSWPYQAIAAEWETVDDEDGIVVSRKEVKNSPLVAFRGVTVMNQSAARLLRVIGDNEHRVNWVDRLKSGKVLERRSFYDFIVYQEFGLPFPISNRDYVYHATAIRSKNGPITLHLASVEHAKAPEPAGVRAHLIDSYYRLIPLGPKKTRVEVEIHTDPKGWLPSWLVNLIQKGWPRKTLTALRSEVAKDWVTPVALPPTSE